MRGGIHRYAAQARLQIDAAKAEKNRFQMDTLQFSIWKRGIFRHSKEIKGLRGGVHRYAAQARPQIDAAMAEKNRFQTKTSYAFAPIIKCFIDDCFRKGFCRRGQVLGDYLPPQAKGTMTDSESAGVTAVCH